MSELFEVQFVLTLIRKHWWKFILGALIAGVLGYGVSKMQTPVFKATTSVMVGRSIQATNLNRSEIQTSQDLVFTYADIVRRQPILQATVEALNLPLSWSQLRNDVQVQIVSGTQLLEISVEANSAEEAQQIADEIAHQLTLISGSQEDRVAESFARQQIVELQDKITQAETRLGILETQVISESSSAEALELQSEMNVLENLINRWQGNYAQLLNVVNSGQAVNDLMIVERAQASSNPIRPETVTNTLIAAVIGFLFAVGLALSIELLDNTIKTPEGIGVLKMPLLGTITRMRKRELPHTLVLNQDPFSGVSEDYRLLRSKLQLSQNSCKSLLFSSAMEGEGKSITVANLGIVMAQAGFKTLIIDANLRQPLQHKIFQISSAKEGLSSLLHAPSPNIEKYLCSTLVPNLQVLVSGELPNNPSELLGFDRMTQLLKSLRQQYNVILLDAPQSLTVADALVLSTIVDGVVFIVATGRTPKNAVVQAVENLRSAGANFLGSVLNMF